MKNFIDKHFIHVKHSISDFNSVSKSDECRNLGSFVILFHDSRNCCSYR